MNKFRFALILLILIAVSLACSDSDLENLSNIGITTCDQKTGSQIITCQSARSDVDEKSEALFPLGDEKIPQEMTFAHINLKVTVEGEGEAEASIKTIDDELLTINATKNSPGEITADVKLYRKSVRSAKEATDTGMSMETVYFIVKVEPVGGKKVEGVQLNFDATLGP